MIPEIYSSDLKIIIHDLLKINPEERPSIFQIIDKPIITKTIFQLIDLNETEYEFIEQPITNISKFQYLD